jgi:CrcB protein
MDRLLWVCLGSALGGGARYLVAQGAALLLGGGFPYGTLAVNVGGSFLISFVMVLGVEASLIPPTLRLFLTTGLMGGFTTYSTFNYETLQMLREGLWGLAGLNLVATVGACLLAGVLGLAAGRVVTGG